MSNVSQLAPPAERRNWRGVLPTGTLRLGLCALVLAFGLLQGGRGESAGFSDLEIKSAFVLNFVRLVNWTSIPGEGNRTELPVCAISKTDFTVAVRDALNGKTVGNRSITVRIDPNPEPARCRVLILDAPQYQHARQALSLLKNAPVLTIGNGTGLIDAGGIFELIVENRKVQFNASLDAIRRTGLDVSARLLHLARNLRTGAENGS